MARGKRENGGVAGDGQGLSLAKPALRVAWSRYVELTRVVGGMEARRETERHGKSERVTIPRLYARS